MVKAKNCSIRDYQEYLISLQAFVVQIFVLVPADTFAATASHQRAKPEPRTGGIIVTATKRKQSISCVSIMFAISNVENAPILPSFLGLRVAGHVHDNEGCLKNIAGRQPDNGQLKTRSVRTILRFMPTTNVTDDLKFSYDNACVYSSGMFHQAVRTNPTTSNQYVLGLNENFCGTGAPRGAFGVANVNLGQNDNGHFRRANDANSYIVANTANVTFDKVTINQIEHCDRAAVAIFTTYNDNVGQQFTQKQRA